MLMLRLPRSPPLLLLLLMSRFGIRQLMCTWGQWRRAINIADRPTDRPHRSRKDIALCASLPVCSRRHYYVLSLHSTSAQHCSLARFVYAWFGLTGHVTFFSPRLLHRAILIILVLFALNFIFTDSFILLLDKPWLVLVYMYICICLWFGIGFFEGTLRKKPSP